MQSLSKVYDKIDGVSGTHNVTRIKLRCFIAETEPGMLEQGKQKFVTTFRFREQPEPEQQSVFIDVVSRPLENHRDIAAEHVDRIWKDSDKHPFARQADKLDQTHFCPYAIAGGYVKRTENAFEFFGESGDYGSDLFGESVNNIAATVLAYCGLPYHESHAVAGSNFLEFTQHFLRSKSCTDQEYHEEWVFETHMRGARMTGQQHGALMYMSVFK